MPQRQSHRRPTAKIVVLTGAGISAESGVATFRDADGIWSKVAIEDVATPQAFARNPAKVHEFYNMRRRDHARVAPNAAHRALAGLEQAGRDLLIVTQNVDALHEQAGSKNLIHMHGELLKALCLGCGDRHHWTGDLSLETPCPACRQTGAMRPDVVWFGEIPYRMDEIDAAVATCDLFVSIGTSGNVYPAANFVAQARSHGAHTVELNLEATSGRFDEAIHGRASDIVPAFVARLLAEN